MITQKSNCLCVWFLPGVLLIAVSAWAQRMPREAAYALKASGGMNPGGSGQLNLPSDPDASSAVNDVAAHDKAPGAEFTPGGNIDAVVQVADPSAVRKSLPATLTVRTAALIELHGMRQSAVDLCLQLPAKYRTKLPQCAEIFRHEIRLKALAKEKQ